MNLDKIKWEEEYSKNERRATATLQGIRLSEEEWLERRWNFGINVLKEIENWVSLDKNSKILDLGSGSNGIFLIPATRIGIKSFGLDISFNALRKLNKRIKYHGFIDRIGLCEGDLKEKLPFKDNMFDAVLSSGTISHIKNVRRLIEELVRITKIGGVVYLSGFQNKFHPNNFPYHIINRLKEKFGSNVISCYYHTLSEIKHMFSIKSFKIVKIEEVHEFIPFYETILYPNYVIKIFNFINDKFLYYFPDRWRIYAKKDL